MKTKRTKVLGVGFIAAVLLLVFGMGNTALGTATIELEEIDSGFTSPSGYYRWLDVADQAYSEAYRNGYHYTQAEVTVDYDIVANGLQGTLFATNLKPNFLYQLKLSGFSGTPTNEAIGLAGRWWQEEWNGTEWANGHNLNNKGDGTSPNPNDLIYYERRDDPDPTSPTGYKYKYTGYLVFEYFITDEEGNGTINFLTNPSAITCCIRRHKRRVQKMTAQ